MSEDGHEKEMKEKLSEMLDAIKKDNRKAITSKYVLPDIVYDGEYFRSEEGDSLGTTADEVIEHLSELKYVAELSVYELNENTLLITKDTTAASMKKWFAEHYMCATVYLKNPIAQICILNIKDAKNVDELVMDVFWSVNSSTADDYGVTVDDLCKMFGM